jgi:hypothetical protein
MRYLLHRVVLTLAVVGVALGSLSLPSAAAAAPSSVPAARYFKETGHNIVGDIKTYYETRGDVPVFGLPLTEVIVENGMQVQYFERARFELHPELPAPHYILLTHLGRHFSAGKTGPAFQPAAALGTNGNVFFRETNHNLFGIFLTYWNSRGGLPVFGYPISEEFEEASPTDGVTRIVQYFERARFEYHPNNPRGQQVQLGLLGRQYLEQSSVPAAARRPMPQLAVLGTATTSYFGSYSERVNNIARGAGRMNGLVVQPGGTFSFNASIGDTGSESGFVDGYAIVGGRLEKVVGGGICQLSTTLYRAVFNAGLQIVSRRNHSYVINFYENVAGWDATVFAPYTDFKWRNDSAGPVWIFTSTNPDKATVTYSLFGYPDGRKTTMVGPQVTNVVQPGKANWQFDPTLAKGQVRQLVHGRPGMDVSMQRVVTAADGKVLFRDNLPSKYKPWEDFYLYGPGVTPPKGVNIIPATTRAAAPSSP